VPKGEGGATEFRAQKSKELIFLLAFDAVCLYQVPVTGIAVLRQRARITGGVMSSQIMKHVRQGSLGEQVEVHDGHSNKGTRVDKSPRHSSQRVQMQVVERSSQEQIGYPLTEATATKLNLG
jgi:hypothetical protein